MSPDDSNDTSTLTGKHMSTPSDASASLSLLTPRPPNLEKKAKELVSASVNSKKRKVEY